MKDPGLQSMQFWKWKFFKWISSRIWKLVECVLTCYIFLTKTKRRKQTCSRRFVSNSDSWRSMSALGWRKNKNSRSPSALSVINARAVLAVESNRTPELSTLFRFKMSDSMYPKSSSPSWENMPRKLKLELWLDKKHGFMDTKIVHDIKKKNRGLRSCNVQFTVKLQNSIWPKVWPNSNWNEIFMINQCNFNLSSIYPMH